MHNLFLFLSLHSEIIVTRNFTDTDTPSIQLALFWTLPLYSAEMAILGYKKKVVATDDVKALKRLIDMWRETDMIHVRSSDVVPDSSNRMHTGISVDHVHYLATKMSTGFHTRKRGSLAEHRQGAQEPHDVPVLVRGSPKCPIARESIAAWREQVEAQSYFPRVTIDDSQHDASWFCSLGNGHFTQALSCFRQQVKSIFDGELFIAPPADAGLNAAVDRGVDSIVLREDTPIEVRREVSWLLNQTHDYKWAVDAAGTMDIDPEHCALHRYSNFEALSKTLDNESLTLLVRLELGVAKELDEREDAERAARNEYEDSELQAARVAKLSSKL